MTITDFLLARIREDELDALPYRNGLGEDRRWAADETGGAVRFIGGRAFNLPDLVAQFETHMEAAHVGRWHPARALAECAAKRAIVEAHPNGNAAYPDSPSLPPYCETCEENHDGAPWPCPTLRALAAVYADHPDYLPEWAL